MALHATLGASSAYRWFACAGSIRESKGMPNESSVYAREGSAAHWILAECLTHNQNALEYLGATVPEYEEIEVEEEMCDAVQQCVDYVRELIRGYEDEGHSDAELGIEVRFDLTHIYPDMFGTCDISLYFPAWRRLHVIDYKHGYDPVSPEENKQIMYYGLGATTGKHNRGVDSISFAIVQPRAFGRTVKEWEATPATLHAFRDELVQKAQATEDENAPLNAGKWCKYCPASPKCKTLYALIKEVTMSEELSNGELLPKAAEQMTPDEMKRIKDNADVIKAWFRNFESYAHREAMAGNPPTGMKLVESDKTHRKWLNENTASAALEYLKESGHLEGEIYTAPEIKSPAQIEVLLGKKHKAMLEGLWVKPRGGMALVPIEDERDPSRVTADQEFSAVAGLL